MSKVYMYVVDRDFGFAPNPFHGFCTLATCKASLRSTARIGDWVFGMGGGRLRATGHCIFAMLITQKVTFDEYWSNPLYFDKKPVRNGSGKMMVGDNIYHFDSSEKAWHQADSHHSNADGSINAYNLRKDTKTNGVLVSTHFFYFGRSAPLVPAKILSDVGFKNGIGHRVFPVLQCATLIDWLEATFKGAQNMIQGDPFDFEQSEKRYSYRSDKIS